jgi:transposase
MKPTTIAVDVAKSVLEVAVSEKTGRVSERKRLSGAQFARFLGRRKPATIVMEACGMAHHWGRHVRRLLSCCSSVPNQSQEATASGPPRGTQSMQGPLAGSALLRRL